MSELSQEMGAEWAPLRLPRESLVTVNTMMPVKFAVTGLPVHSHTKTFGSNITVSGVEFSLGAMISRPKAASDDLFTPDKLPDDPGLAMMIAARMISDARLGPIGLQLPQSMYLVVKLDGRASGSSGLELKAKIEIHLFEQAFHWLPGRIYPKNQAQLLAEIGAVIAREIVHYVTDGVFAAKGRPQPNATGSPFGGWSSRGWRPPDEIKSAPVEDLDGSRTSTGG